MFDVDYPDLIINRYEIGCIINNNRYIIDTTNDIAEATQIYEKVINAKRDSTSHVIVFLYDYDKNANLNYYDSETD